MVEDADLRRAGGADGERQRARLPDHDLLVVEIQAGGPLEREAAHARSGAHHHGRPRPQVGAGVGAQRLGGVGGSDHQDHLGSVQRLGRCRSWPARSGRSREHAGAGDPAALANGTDLLGVVGVGVERHLVPLTGPLEGGGQTTVACSEHCDPRGDHGLTVRVGVARTAAHRDPTDTIAVRERGIRVAGGAGVARLVAGGSRRYPEARPERTDLGWLIRLDGPGEDVLPAGVEEAGDRRPLELATTVDDAYLNLDRVSRIEDDEDAADALAAHARRHPVARFLCHHGLPMWHGGPESLPHADEPRRHRVPRSRSGADHDGRTPRSGGSRPSHRHRQPSRSARPGRGRPALADPARLPHQARPRRDRARRRAVPRPLPTARDLEPAGPAGHVAAAPRRRVGQPRRSCSWWRTPTPTSVCTPTPSPSGCCAARVRPAAAAGR